MPLSVVQRRVLGARPNASFDCRSPKNVRMFHLNCSIRVRIGATNEHMTKPRSTWQPDSAKTLRQLEFLALFGAAALCLDSVASESSLLERVHRVPTPQNLPGRMLVDSQPHISRFHPTVAITAISRTQPWLASGWGCR